MQLLEYYQSQYPKSDYFIPRKQQIPLNGDLNLFGVRGSGKTALVLDFITEEDKERTLYIDFQDPNLTFNTIDSTTLQQYIDKNSITLLILDHYEESHFQYFPNVERLIVITRIALRDDAFNVLELFPLDYEEFLAFENSTVENRGFNNFLRLGTLPLLASTQKSASLSMKLFFQSSFSEPEQKLLLILAQHHTKHLTINQIYSYAKEQFKVSKDWLYKTMKSFKEEKLILFINDHYQKSGKKMLLFDFAFAKYLTVGQPFILQFDTMIALALIKHYIKVETLGIHGYITKNSELIIPAPFESEESLWVKSQNKFSIYKKYGIKKVTIVTVANAYEYDIEQLHFEALPFNEWSVINDEEN